MEIVETVVDKREVLFIYSFLGNVLLLNLELLNYCLHFPFQHFGFLIYFLQFYYNFQIGIRPIRHSFVTNTLERFLRV